MFTPIKSLNYDVMGVLLEWWKFKFLFGMKVYFFTYFDTEKKINLRKVPNGQNASSKTENDFNEEN